MKKISTKELVITALLIAIGILIPMISPVKIPIGPYTATLMSHVPVIIAMFMSPLSALFTAIGTTIGFQIAGFAPVVVVRAASHIVFALVGSYLITKTRTNLIIICIITGLLHAIFEGLSVLVFLQMGWTSSGERTVLAMVSLTMIGTFIHHIMDYIIACAVYKGLIRAKAVPSISQFGGKK